MLLPVQFGLELTALEMSVVCLPTGLCCAYPLYDYMQVWRDAGLAWPSMNMNLLKAEKSC